MRAVAAAFVGVLASALIAAGQQAKFSSESAVVRLVVSVTDAKGVVSGLGNADFIVTDNGQRQAVDVDEGADAPLDVVAVAQPLRSIAMTSTEQATRMAAGLGALLSQIRDSDRFGAVLAGAPPMRLRGLETGRPSFDAQAFLAGDYAAPFDAIAGALPEFGASDRRQALIAFTAGADFRSTLTLDVLARAAKRQGPALIFVAAPIRIDMALFGSGSGATGEVSGWTFPAAIRDLARTTGGLTLDLGRGEPSAMIADLVRRLRTQYVLSYAAPAGKGWHAVSVKVARKGATATTREGYWVE